MLYDMNSLSSEDAQLHKLWTNGSHVGIGN